MYGLETEPAKYWIVNRSQLTGNRDLALSLLGLRF
jgi:hypothetical protein